MTRKIPVNVDFTKLRDAQHAILREVTWMLAEMGKLRAGNENQRASIAEAVRQIGSLGAMGQEFLDPGYAELKQFALIQRTDQPYSDTNIRLTLKRLLNGLHATVGPIDGLIRRLCDTSEDAPVSISHGESLSMILMTGMTVVMQAVSGIDDELRSLLDANLEGNPDEDFGIYDPGTD